MFKRFPRYVPDEYWYSDEPYIDGDIRIQRYLKVVGGMKAAGYDVGPFAERAITKITATGKNQLDDDLLTAAGDDGKMQISQKSTETKAAEAPIRVSCSLPPEQHILRNPAIVVKRNQEFYGVFEVPKVPEAPPVDTNTWLKDTSQSSYRKLKKLILRRAEPLPPVFFPTHDQIAISALDPTFNKSVGKVSRLIVEVERDYGPQTRLIQEGVNGYNIIQIRADFYAIKQGFPFDKDRADKNLYVPGLCIKGRNVRELISQLERFKSPPAASLDASPA